MATVDKWRTCLNNSSFCKKLRENNATESKPKLQTESKSLVEIDGDDLFIWDNSAAHLVYFNLKSLSNFSERPGRNQILQCTDAPQFEVEQLVWNPSRTHLALWGQLGVMVLELPQKWGKYAEFQGGRDTVLCKSVSIGEHYFSGHRSVKLLHVAWHPASVTGTHVVFLTSDNLLSIYDLMEPESPTSTVYLGDNDPSFSLSVTRPTMSSALGDNVMGFDFGPPVDVQSKYRTDQGSGREMMKVWPVYCVRGNGDVIVAYTDISSSKPLKMPIQGPLLMHPPSEDNYGNDACSILILPTTPTMVVITTCDGRLHHCMLLPKDEEDSIAPSESSYRSVMDDTCPYNTPDEMLLYVYETVELELSLATPTFTDTPTFAYIPTTEEIFTCPIRLIKDISSPQRYHCAHAAGVHTVAVPWIQDYQLFFVEDADEDTLPAHQDSIVEHLICTKPLPNSPPAPILGLAVARGTSLGAILLALSSDFEFQCLRLSDMRHTATDSMLVSSTQGQTIPSPLRKISREPFDDRIRRILRRATSNPLLKSRQSTELSQQECFQLLSRTTQVFREEYIQKQDLARQEIRRRVSILKDQRKQQEADIQKLEETKADLGTGAERLANMCEDCKERQEDLLKKIENIMRKLQARVPYLSDSERNMKRELENMEEKLETYQRSLEQLRIKRDYQQRQVDQHRRTTHPSPIIKKNQMSQLKEVLKQEGEELDGLVKKLTSIKVDNDL